MAEGSGVSAKLIGHYKANGLVRPERKSNKYRAYTDKRVSVLRFIRHARELNFLLAEVRNILALWSDDQKAPEEPRASALRHVGALEEKARSMQAVAKALRDLTITIETEEKSEVPRFEAA
ncbi:MerR family DNA-binding protein [Sabulicella glaciei]|uniref:MerR family DNA-binding protein n=1 Tax=Sabulicella glaciei TaxID=2984948 RepID=A0ABT3P1Y0_9PROT|nr:MerR family DNA-binding protein [Roseococcus sp. MDT2-1-1]